MGRFVLTGSQKLPLMREAAESLAGRVAIFELEGLTAAELATSPDLPRTPSGLAKLVVRGGYPELWRQPDLDHHRFYQSYLTTYLERDLRQLIDVGKLRDFERFMRLAATRTGQLLNKSDLARDVGVSVTTIGDWLSALEASNQVVLLSPYFENVGKRVVKTPQALLRR